MPYARSLVENLENRRLLAASVPQSVLAAGYAPIEWHGQQAYARPGEWLLKVDDVSGRPDAQLRKIDAALAGLGQGLKAKRMLGSDGLVSLAAPKTLGLEKLTGLLKKLDRFAYVEPDLALWAAATTSNDPSAASQWALNNAGQTGGTADADVDAHEAWDLARGSGSAVVGVIDSGIDYAHPDLRDNMWTNAREVAGNGLDDDGNGYADDVHGWDFYNNDANPTDDNGHGTHVAGTIGATGNNGAGVAGVNWNVDLMALKFLGADGSGSLSAAIGAINYATKMKVQFGVDVRVTNNSWSGGGYSTALYDAINQSGQAGMLFVAAAGNGGADQVGDNNDSVATYPASYGLNNVIAVAATDHNDALASFSNYGATAVDLAAPGVSILSTTRGGSYGSMSGTSMAAPHVAGVVALAWSYLPSASADTVRAAVLNGVDAKGSLAGKVATGGRLNAYNTLRLLTPQATVPNAPSALAATAASSSRVDLKWADNSTNETGFRVLRSTDGVNFATVATLAAGATGYADLGLAASTTYSYRVTAYNATGTSAASNMATATTAAASSLPAAPDALSATATGRSTVALAWRDNSGNEAGFKIERAVSGGRWTLVATVGANATAYTDGGLKRNTAYAYRVRSYNATGHSAYSNVATTQTRASSQSIASAGLFSDAPVSDGSDWKDSLLA